MAHQKLSIQNKIARYIDSGFPILYFNTYEEDKADSIINSIRAGKEVYEWNETNGYIDFSNKAPLYEDCSLENMLDDLKINGMLDGKIIILKDVNAYLSEPHIVSKIKGLARMIGQGADASIIIVSNILIIPKELEKFITIVEMDYLNHEEIKEVIHRFVKDQEIDHVSDALIEKLAIAFKGMSEFEIYNLLALSYADDGQLTSSDLSIIFEQKQQIVKKAGILEMIPLRETIDDIGGLENLKEWLHRKEKVLKNINEAQEYGVDTRTRIVRLREALRGI